MSKNKILYALAGLVAGCLVGFFFANSVNRQELEELRAEVARARANGNAGNSQQNDAPNAKTASSDNAADMPDESEMRDLIKRADERAQDTDYQRKVGQGVYMYCLGTNQPALMPEAVRLLKRAHEADAQNYETTVLTGNALFALGQAGDAAKYAEARTYYNQALRTKPTDANVHALLGMTYYFGSPSDPARAVKEYRQSLTTDARHEMALQSLSAALIATGALVEAQQRIDELQAVNTSNASLANLRAQLSQARNAAKERQ